MAASDSELLEFYSNGQRPRIVRPQSAPPCRRSTSTPGAQALRDLNLEEMTAEAIALFREGEAEEALSLAVEFSQLAMQELGRTHPTYINALATVAALVHQVGGQREATALLKEAEELQAAAEELEMEELAQQLDEELDEMDLSSEAEAEYLAIASGDSSRHRGTGSKDSRRSRTRKPRAEDSNSPSDGEADSERGLAETESESEEEAEAVLITRATFEVNALLKEGRAKEAAMLLSAVEAKLVEPGDGVAATTQAALHTLWATILDSVGESEKAQCLFDEAIDCLQREVGVSSSNSELESLEMDDDESLEDEEDARASPSPQPSESPAAVADSPEGKGQEEPFSPSFFVTAEEEPPAVEEEIKEELEEGPSCDPPEAPRVETARGKPQPAPRLPQAPHSARTTRVGGGFVGVRPQKPPNPATAPATKWPTRKLTTKASATKAPKEAPKPVVLEVPASTQAVAAPPEEESAPVTASPGDAKREMDEVQHSMTTADHFLGLLNFERAADKLEEQLKRLDSKESHHRHTDLHVDVLMKYGGVLWWDGDPEGALDAFQAADEIMEERGSLEPRVQQRRASIWGQLAQVHRCCGELDMADEKLTQAVEVLERLAEAEGPDQTELDETLRDSKAALAQVCVQKSDFDRAEKLYLEAFAAADGSSSDEPVSKPSSSSKSART